ncbi:hypothetical protein [Pseudomonas putida]|uniref:Glycosyltransferase RgtA/B/C/D-like domain-containing protein n=1 Tax=Pseudomonas putida TaxID=303 RepID=A0A2C5VJ36_PSEPU|nr:hypothetical protein [Pseudomonas putida]PHH38738.1 hypothetical protein CRX57_00625 [Pseudomonas putida]
MLFKGGGHMCSPFNYAAILVATLILISFQIRTDDFSEQKAAPNIAATYHVLLTVKALDQSPASDHYFLPTTSLGGTANKGIPWGVTVPTPRGDYIYTSFYAPAFVAPYIWFKLLDQKATTSTLAYFSFALNSLTCLLIFILCYRLLVTAGTAPKISAAGSLTAVFITLFSREALLSGGLIYWAQSLYQPILVASLICLHTYLSTATDKARVWSSGLLVALSILGALTEWTGFVFNGGVVLILWVINNNRLRNRKLAAGIAIATLFSVAIIVLHISAAVGFKPTIDALIERFFARSTSAGNFGDLLQGYWISYGLFLPLLLAAATLSLVTKSSKKSSSGSAAIIIFIASCFPMLENILMMQHATAFTFDRLKLVIPAGILISYAFCITNTTGKALIIGASIASSIFGYATYRNEISNYSPWVEIEKQNQAFAEELKSRPDYACSVLASSIPVRAYANLLFDRGIFEVQTSTTTAQLMKTRGACASIFIEGDFVYPGITRYTRATIKTTDGKIETIAIP